MKTPKTISDIGAGTICAGMAQGCVAVGITGRKSGRGFDAYERGE